MTQMPMASYGMNMGGNIDPALGMDSYTMGDGLEAAMGLTIGVGSFGEYFGDDMFSFNGLMDSGGPVFEGL